LIEGNEDVERLVPGERDRVGRFGVCRLGHVAIVVPGCDVVPHGLVVRSRGLAWLTRRRPQTRAGQL
jgi:hypothetical protein